MRDSSTMAKKVKKLHSGACFGSNTKTLRREEGAEGKAAGGRPSHHIGAPKYRAVRVQERPPELRWSNPKP